MNDNGLNREGFRAAEMMVRLLQGTVESLQLNMSQERDANDGMQLTLESLKEENERLQEENFQLQAELQSLKEKEDKPAPKADSKSSPALVDLGKKLKFYYEDMQKVDAKNLTAEDSETLYNILDYTFKTLKKAGMKL